MMTRRSGGTAGKVQPILRVVAVLQRFFVDLMCSKATNHEHGHCG